MTVTTEFLREQVKYWEDEVRWWEVLVASTGPGTSTVFAESRKRGLATAKEQLDRAKMRLEIYDDGSG